MLACSRFMLWTARTPEMFSCRPEFTTAMAPRTRMNVPRAALCHTTRMTNSTGATDSVIRPRLGSIAIIAATMPTRLNMLSRLVRTTSMNACSCCTSFCTRDIRMPVSLRSKKDIDSR